MFTNPICHWASSGSTPPLLNYAPGANATEDPTDIQMPTETVFYDTSAALVAAGVPAPTFLHPCQEAAGTGTIADVAGGGLNLTSHGNVIQGQRCVGLWDEANQDFLGRIRRAVEAQYAGNCGFIGPDNLLGDPGADSLACFFVFRCTLWNTTEYQLVGKKISSSLAGWNITAFNGTNIRIQIEDAGGIAVNASVGDQFEQGAYVSVLGTLNRNTGFLRIWTSQRGWSGSVALGAIGNIVAAGHPFAIFSDNSGGMDNAHAQICYVATWIGGNAEDIDANWDAIYRPILVPFNTNPTPLAFEGGSDCDAAIVGEDPTLGTMIAAWGGYNTILAGSDQFSWAYDPAITRANKLCHPCHPRILNLVESDRFNLAAWTKTNTTVSFAWADMTEAPDGMHLAELITAGAGAPRQCRDTNVVVVAGEYYGIELFVKRGTAMGADVAGQIEIYDFTNGASITTLPFTATTKWQHLWLEFQAPVGCVRVEYRIEITNQGDAIHAYRAVATRYGYQRTPICSSGSMYARSNFQGSTGLTPANTIHGDQGEIEIQTKGFTNNALFFDPMTLVHAQTAGTLQNARIVKITDTAPHVLSCDVYNSASALDHTITYGAVDWSLEHNIQVRWNIAGLPSGNTSEIIVDGGAPVAGSVAAWAVSDTCDNVAVGGEPGGPSGNAFTQGEIVYAKIWATPQ